MTVQSQEAQDMSRELAQPTPEVSEKATRRSFKATYKLRILEEADRCLKPGELGELLRREGLYSSHLSNWREQRDAGTLAGLAPQRRGRKAKRQDPIVEENERLRRENERLSHRLKQAEAIIDVQKKVAEILGVTLPEANGGKDS